MKKIFSLFLAVVCCSTVFGQIISVTDGTLSDWDNVPSEYLFKTECAPNASMDGLKSVQVYVDLTYINLLVEVNDDVVTDREWTPFQVFINSDNNSSTGGYGDLWTDADVDFMLETAIYQSGAVAYNPAVFKWWGANGENGWLWTNPDVESTAENGWGALVPEGSMPIGNAQMVDGKIEIQLDYTLIPMPFDETTFTLGFDIQQSWNPVGVLPNANDAEDGAQVLAEKLRVYVHPQNKTEYAAIDGIKYKVTSDAEPHTAEVFSLLNKEASITEIAIPKTIALDGITYTVTSIGSSAFRGCSSLTSITIPNSVTSIGDYAFSFCSSLTSVTIGNSVTSIGNSAFSSCYALTSIAIPNSVTSIGDYAFSWCSALTSITIPNSVTSIGYYAFSGCTFTKDNFISHSTLDAEANNYWGATIIKGSEINGLIIRNDTVIDCRENVTSVEIPYYVKGIGDFAFQYCSSLTSVTIPNSVTSIGVGAFQYCSALTSITIPNSVTSIGSSAFSSCSSIASIIVKAGNATYDSRENCNAIIETATNTLIAGCKNTNIPNTVTSIGEGAFYGCSSLTSITLPNKVTSIGAAAFSSCSSLTSIAIPNTVTSIGDNAFSWCSSLTSITIPNSVTSIGDWAFSSCSSLTSVTIGNSVTSIGDRAFSNCSSLNSITIPNSVTSMGEWVFEDCRSLVSATIGDGVTSIGSGTFSWCYSLASVSLGKSIESIEPMAFNYCWSLTTLICKAIDVPVLKDEFYGVYLNEVTLYVPAQSLDDYKAAWSFFGTILPIEGEEPEEPTVDNYNIITYTSTDGKIVTPQDTDVFGTNIVSNTYENGVGSITFEGPVTSIGNSAFEYCTSLTSITIPNSVTSIGAEAFYWCSALTSITIPNSVTSIGDDAFEYCSALTSVTIPNSVTSIGERVFSWCSALTSVTIPNSVTSIESLAFFYCSALTFVTIPNSVTSIGDEAFGGCYSLTSIVVESGNSTYDSRENCNAIIETATNTLIAGCKNTVIPNSVTSIGDYAFAYCDSLTSITIPNSVTSIGNGAFEGCSALTSITIPNSVTSIGERAFYYCESLKTVICEAIEVPELLGGDVFYDMPLSETTLYVPAQSLDDYKAAEQWKDFGTILPIEGEEPEEDLELQDTDVSIVFTNSEDNNSEIYRQTLTIKVPVAPTIEGFTFLKWRVVEGDLTDVITIQAIYEADIQSSAPDVYTNPANPAQKLIRDGQVYILQDGKTYTIMGAEIR